VAAAVRVSDGMVVVVDAVDGLMLNTERVIRQVLPTASPPSGRCQSPSGSPSGACGRAHGVERPRHVVQTPLCFLHPYGFPQ
jgi:hypothetical protein